MTRLNAGLKQVQPRMWRRWRGSDTYRTCSARAVLEPINARGSGQYPVQLGAIVQGTYILDLQVGGKRLERMRRSTAHRARAPRWAWSGRWWS